MAYLHRQIYIATFTSPPLHRQLYIATFTSKLYTTSNVVISRAHLDRKLQQALLAY